MDVRIHPSTLHGAVRIPASKSHTIRAIALAALAEGESIIRFPLDSADTRAAVRAYRALGAQIHTDNPEAWRVRGTAGRLATPDDVVDTANSGTTMNVALGSASLVREGLTVLTGDVQVRRRPSGPLAEALNALGAIVRSTRNNGCPPFVVEGLLRGGEATLRATSSQYVTSILLNAPLADGDTLLHVPLLYEQPYVWMTLDWLRYQGITVEYTPDLSRFHVKGGQAYHAFTRDIPADFSSATFFLAAGAMQGNDVLCLGLDMHDTQGDKAVVEYLAKMGACVEVTDNAVRVQAQHLRGSRLDLNDTPDALPMMAALASLAEGTTVLYNVPQARQKETDRIAVMAQELSKLGAIVHEQEDGLEIVGASLHSATVEGHGDHRVIMALAVLATQIPGGATIRGCDAVHVTFPTFFQALENLGAVVERLDEGPQPVAPQLAGH